ncbi:hypothetical protein TUM4644_31830 [Shewanella colwelliana]|nr:hypothetical protein TUM4644_31830 [Shewanella colwelliana]
MPSPTDATVIPAPTNASAGEEKTKAAAPAAIPNKPAISPKPAIKSDVLTSASSVKAESITLYVFNAKLDPTKAVPNIGTGIFFATISKTSFRPAELLIN